MGNNDSQPLNQDINIKGDLNIYICGDINNNENYNILTDIFNTENLSLNGYIKIKDINTRYLYEYRKLIHKIKTIDEKEVKTIYNAFLFINNNVDESFSHILFHHFYEEDRHNRRNNVIINFGVDNIIQKKMNELINISRESIPFIIHINDYIQNYDEKLSYVNYIPSLDSIENNLRNDNPNLSHNNLNKGTMNEILKRYINLKLFRICAYYKEMGYNLNMINPLNEMNLRIKFHLTIALCGYSGCGKSTLLNLIFKELVSKAVSSSTDISTKCSEYYLPIQKINNKNNHIGQIRFLDFPGITKNDNYKNVVEKSIKEKIKEFKTNLEQIDIALFFISNGIGREFTNSGKELVNLLYNNKIRIIFIINGPINAFLLNEKKRKIKNVINNDNILDNNFDDLLSTNFYQYHENEGREGIREIFDKIIQKIQIKIPDYNAQKINIDNYNEQLNILKKKCRVFELFENINVMKKSAKIKATWCAVLYSSLACGSSCISLIVPFVDTVLAIGYQVAMIFNIFYIFDIDIDDYSIVNIYLSGGNDISKINNNNNNENNEQNINNNEVKDGNVREILGNTAKSAVFVGKKGIEAKAASELSKKIIEKEIEKIVINQVEVAGVKITQKGMEAIVKKGSEIIVENTVQQMAVVSGTEAAKEIVKQGLKEGAKQVTTEIAKEGLKEGVKQVSTEIAKEGVKQVTTEITKEGIKHFTEEIAKEGVKQVTTEIAKEGLKEGAKQVTTEVLKETVKEGAIVVTKEGFEGIAIQGTKQTITQVTEQIVIKEGGKKGWIYLGKAVPFIGAGISCVMNTFSTGKLGYKLVNFCVNDFENNQMIKVNMLKGRVLALENVIQQIRMIQNLN